MGELGELEKHLNSNPSQDKQLEGCQFTEVQCLHCSMSFQRSNVEVHQNDQCLKRPFSCEYCKDHDSTYEDVTTSHWPVCGNYPLQCPNKCSNETIECRSLDSHITNDCPLTIIDCDFKHVGCEVRLPRKDLPTHLTESLVPHVSLQTKRLMDLEKENKQLKQQVEKLTEDHKTHDQLKQQIEKLTEDFKQYLGKSIEEHDQQVKKLMEDLKTHDQLKQQVEEVARDLHVYQFGTPLCPAEITMAKFEQHKKACDGWNSPAFYTQPKGYKMYLHVVAAGNGDGIKTHVSLFLYLMKGEYDEQLKWPFQGKFVVELLSQDGDGRHSETITFDTNTPDEYCSRLYRKRARQGWGCPTFIPHTELKPTYLQNDCLKFCIKKVD